MIPKEIQEIISKFEELRPPQKKAIEKGLLDGKNIVVAAPTGSGKTLVAKIAIVNNLLKGKKAIYIVPLKALAIEKFKEFKDEVKWAKTAISIGDLDSSDPWLKDYDIIIVTSEKMDSLIRHGANWIRDVGTVVIDEIHLIGETERGPTLELLITELREICKAQFIGLSATINNAEEIAKWLNAELVKSDYRPIKLKEGVYYDGEIKFKESTEAIQNTYDDPVIDLTIDTLKMNKQALFFFMSRRNAEAGAKKLKQFVKKYLSKEEKEYLEILSNEVLHVLEKPTKQCEKLAEVVKCGVAFHHAGLVNKQRELIENAFRERKLKVICATPTLALGVNLPTFRAIVRDLKRYSEHFGADWIPVLEWKQMIGRAGRPGLEKYGEGIAVAKTPSEVDLIMKKYVLGKPEDIYSKLSSEPALRTSLLGLIGTMIFNRRDAEEFFSKTFFAFQYGERKKIMRKVNDMIDLLIELNFVNERNGLKLTKIGKRVAELYLDPLSADWIIQKLEENKKNPLFYLMVISKTYEMRPWPQLKRNEFFEIQSEINSKKKLLPKIPDPWDFDYEEYIRAYKLARILFDWINEKTEEEILEKYNETPGRLYSKLTIADWLLYSASELARLLNKKEHFREINKLRIRLKYGVKEELVELVQIEGIGRVKARKLYKAGIKSIADLRKTPLEKLKKILGPKTAEKVLGGIV